MWPSFPEQQRLQPIPRFIPRQERAPGLHFFNVSIGFQLSSTANGTTVKTTFLQHNSKGRAQLVTGPFHFSSASAVYDDYERPHLHRLCPLKDAAPTVYDWDAAFICPFCPEVDKVDTYFCQSRDTPGQILLQYK